MYVSQIRKLAFLSKSVNNLQVQMKPAMEWQIDSFSFKNGFLDPKLVQFDVKNVKIGP